FRDRQSGAFYHRLDFGSGQLMSATHESTGHARWYIVHAYSNFEQKVAEAIRDQAERQGLKDQFVDIQVPTEEVTEIVRGAKKVRQNRHFPGYVLVKMDMT